MVREILRTLTAPVRGLHQAAYLLAALTLASQVLALMRDRLFAHSFGASEILDLYYAAFKVPDLIFALVASLVSAYVLIPRLSGSGSHEEAKRLIAHTASFLVIGGGIVCAVLALFAPQLLFLLFPAFAASVHAHDFVLLARILLLQPILLGLSGVLTSVTQVERRFALFALSPVLYNLGIIAGTVFLYPVYGLPGIGIGVVLGAFVHMAIHLPVVARAGLLPRPTWPSASLMWGVVKDSVPRSLALGMSSLSALLLVSLASRTGEGSVSLFTLAGNLAAVPLSLIGASYATAAFPVMAAHLGADRREAFKETLTTAARHIIFWSATLTVLVLVLRAHVVRIILGTGAFDWNDTRLAAAALGALILSLLAQGLVLLAARAFYAAGRSWNPLLIQVGNVIVSVGAAWVLLRLAHEYTFLRYFMEGLFHVGDLPGVDVLFIALGATIGQLTMAFIALYTLRRVAPGVAGELIRPMLQGFGAAIIGGAAGYFALSLMGNLAPLTTLMAVFTQGAVAGMVGFIVAAAVLALLENQEFRDLYESLRRLTGTKALAPYGAVVDETLE